METTRDLKAIRQFTFQGIERPAGWPVAVFTDQHTGERRPLDLNSLRARRQNLAKLSLYCAASDSAIGLLERATKEFEASARPAEEAP